MVVRASEQTTATRAIALLNKERHRKGICAANHSIEYDRGWFTVDGGERFRRPDIVELAKRTKPVVLYWQEGNCYVTEG